MDDEMKFKDNLGWQRFFSVMREWGIMVALMIALHVVYFLGWIILGALGSRSFTPYLVLTIGYVVCLGWLGLIFFRRLDRAHVPVEHREAHSHGQAATGKVLAIEQTGWASGRQRRSMTLKIRPFSLRYRHPKREYQMRVRVIRPGESDYEAQLAVYLLHDQVPRMGDTISIKVHPNRPEIVVWAQP
jgi:hypothetical protein